MNPAVSSDDDINNANLEQPEESEAAHLFGNILLLQTTLMLGKASPKMQCACFVIKALVDAAPPEQIESFFYENSISFNVANTSSFACMIEESMKYAKQYLLQRYKAPSPKQLSGDQRSP